MVPLAVIPLLAFFHMSGLSHGYSYTRYYNRAKDEDVLSTSQSQKPVAKVVPYTLLAGPLGHGGAIYWDQEARALYFVDTAENTLYRYEPATDSQKFLKFDDPVSMVIPIKGQKHRTVISLGSEIAVLRWLWDSSGNFTTTHLFSEGPPSDLKRWNTGKADSVGRIWAGAVDSNPNSTFYCVDAVQSCRANDEHNGDSIGNDFVWSLDNKILYFSSPRKIEAFDFNLERRSLTNRRTVFDFGIVPGTPAGLTIDSEGNLWIACWECSQVLQVNASNGQLLTQIMLPVKYVTSVAFGGPNLDVLYVTSAASGEGSLDGVLLKITDLQATGTPMSYAIVNCNPCNDNSNRDSSWWCSR